MRVFTEAKALETKRDIQARLAALDKERALLHIQLEMLGVILAEMEDVAGPVASAIAEPSNVVTRGDDGLFRSDTDDTPTAEADAPRAFRRPAKEGSPVSRVQIPVYRLVEAERGIKRAEAISRIAAEVGTSEDSVRESIRRMVQKGRLWLNAHGGLEVAGVPGVTLNLAPKDDAVD